MTLKPIDEEKLIDRFEELKQKLDFAAGNWNEFNRILKELDRISENLPLLKGWKSDRRVFWDNASADWFLRIDKNVREFVSTKVREQIRNNAFVVELGSGSWQTVPKSVCVDISKNMLQELRAKKRVLCDLECQLPFKSSTVDVVVMVFIANYIEHLSELLCEVKRVLKERGRLVIVQSTVPVNSYHRMMEKYAANGFEEILINILEKNKFRVNNHIERIETHKIDFIAAEKL